MIEIGKYNTLRILRTTSVGLYLGDEDREDVLLPNKYCPENYELDDDLEVFVYLDYADRKVATNIRPPLVLHEFALLQVKEVSEVGAFMDWGLEKDLLVPFREQRMNMEEGRWYVIFLDLDEQSDRLYGSNKIEDFLENEELEVETGDKVEVTVFRKTDLGYSVIINNFHQGLIFENEIFKQVNIGDKLTGYIKNIREDNKIDISLQAIGYENFNDDNATLIYKRLKDEGGTLGISDKSSPDDIYTMFGISKKAFKRATGLLYRERKILITPSSISLV